MYDTGAAQRSQLVGDALTAYHQVGLLLRRATNPTWLQLDLTMLQVKSLLLLAVRQSMTLGELATELDVSRQVGSTHLEPLRKRGLIDRASDPGDRRRQLIRLTPQAQPLVDQLNAVEPDCLQSWLRRMATRDLQSLQQGLAALAAAIAVPAGNEP